MFHKGDRVIHRSYGLGHFVRWESYRTGETIAYVDFDAEPCQRFNPVKVAASNLYTVSVCPKCGRLISALLPLHESRCAERPTAHDGFETNVSWARAQAAAIGEINEGENRYRQTVLGQGPLPSYPSVGQYRDDERCVCGHKFDDHSPCGTCDHDCDCVRFEPFNKSIHDEPYDKGSI